MAPNRSVLVREADESLAGGRRCPCRQQQQQEPAAAAANCPCSLPVTMVDMETTTVASADDPLDLCVPGAGLSCPLLPALPLPPDDDELTNLTWLQDHNLLKSIRVGAEDGAGAAAAPGAAEDCLLLGDLEAAAANGAGVDGGVGGCLADSILLLQQPPNVRYNPQLHVTAKPPYSFSCLIFMAIEDAPTKALPVKDIYSWILSRFPYFQNAPTGWKNSVRHNLSLNKCFRKVDKDKGQNIGKGSLWCIDPDFRPNLLQALRKTPYHPYHQLQMLATPPAPTSPLSQKSLPLAPRTNINIPSPELFPYLSKRLAASNIKVDPEVDAAATMLALKNGPHLLSCDEDQIPKNGNGAVRTSSERRKKRLRSRLCTAVNEYHSKLKKFVPVITCSPSEDHTYSTCSPQNGGIGSPTSSSSIDEPFEFSEASNSDEGNDSLTNADGTESNLSSYNDDEFESCDEDDEDWDKLVHKNPHFYRANEEDEEEEEQKKIVEGADALLNLAGIKTHLHPLRRTSIRSTNCSRKSEMLFELAQR